MSKSKVHCNITGGISIEDMKFLLPSSQITIIKEHARIEHNDDMHRMNIPSKSLHDKVSMTDIKQESYNMITLKEDCDSRGNKIHV